MADSAPAGRRDEEPTLGPPPTPRWVKQFAVVAIVLILAFGLPHATGHGLGHHMHGGEAPCTAVPKGGP